MGEKGGIARSCVHDAHSNAHMLLSPPLPYISLFLLPSHYLPCLILSVALPHYLSPSAVGLVRLLAALLQPYTPSLSAKVLLQLNLPESALLLNAELIQVGGRLWGGHLSLNDELIQVGAPLALTYGRCGLKQRRGCLDIGDFG